MNSIGHCIGNFRAYLAKDGLIVPSSLREGHNVITRTGEEWLANLVAWLTLGSGIVDDVPITTDRIRWLGVGSGYQLETPHVQQLTTPIQVTSGKYFAKLDPAVDQTYPVITAVKYVHVFATSDLITAPVTVSEAAIVVGDEVHDADPPAQTTAVAFYKRIEPAIVKDDSHTLTIEWEFRF